MVQLVVILTIPLTCGDFFLSSFLTIVGSFFILLGGSGGEVNLCLLAPGSSILLGAAPSAGVLELVFDFSRLELCFLPFEISTSCPRCHREPISFSDEKNGSTRCLV